MVEITLGGNRNASVAGISSEMIVWLRSLLVEIEMLLWPVCPQSEEIVWLRSLFSGNRDASVAGISSEMIVWFKSLLVETKVPLWPR